MAEYLELDHTATNPESINEVQRQSLIISFLNIESHEKVGLRLSREPCITA